MPPPAPQNRPPAPPRIPEKPLATRALQGPRFPEEVTKAAAPVRFVHTTADGLKIELSLTLDAADPVLAQGQMFRMLSAMSHACYPGLPTRLEFTRGLIASMAAAIATERSTRFPQVVTIDRELLTAATADAEWRAA